VRSEKLVAEAGDSSGSRYQAKASEYREDFMCANSVRLS
jgi:hypothetical protein